MTVLKLWVRVPSASLATLAQIGSVFKCSSFVLYLFAIYTSTGKMEALKYLAVDLFCIELLNYAFYYSG